MTAVMKTIENAREARKAIPDRVELKCPACDETKRGQERGTTEDPRRVTPINKEPNAKARGKWEG